MAEVASRSRRDAMSNPAAQLSGDRSVDELLAEPLIADPLRKHDCAPITDGAAAVILARGPRAYELCERPAWITGFDHRIDSAEIGGRELTTSPSASIAAERATGGSLEGITVAELHAPFTHQELILRSAMGLDGADITINPSGGALAGNPMFAAGLERIGNAALRVMAGTDRRALAHATSGPLLQQNLVCVLEGRN